MHLSQPTISRDINFIRKQNSSTKKKNLDYRYYYEQQNALDGIAELMKNFWLIIIDNPKIQVKEQMKAMKLIMQCYYMRSKLLNSEAFNQEFIDYTKKVKSDEGTLRIREEKICEREKALEFPKKELYFCMLSIKSLSQNYPPGYYNATS